MSKSPQSRSSSSKFAIFIPENICPTKQPVSGGDRINSFRSFDRPTRLLEKSTSIVSVRHSCSRLLHVEMDDAKFTSRR